MKKRIAYLLLIFFVLSAPVLSQKGRIIKDDLHGTLQQINDPLPSGWTIGSNTTNPNKILIQSLISDHTPGVTSNDTEISDDGQCDIYFLLLPCIVPDSISLIQSRNKMLRESLLPQNYKDNVKNWYTQNAKTLKILNAGPANFDDFYTYRIACLSVSKFKGDRPAYEKIRFFLNLLFRKYDDWQII